MPATHHKHYKMQIAYLINTPDYQECDRERLSITYFNTSHTILDTASKPLYGNGHRHQRLPGHANTPPDATSLSKTTKRVSTNISAAVDMMPSCLQDQTIRKKFGNNERFRYHEFCFSPSGTARLPSKLTRPARPSYDPEQKFFIMYYRIVKKLPWFEIEQEYKKVFGLRTKDGLTSVYYRIRHEWGMRKVEDATADDVAARRKRSRKCRSCSRQKFCTGLGVCHGGRNSCCSNCGH